MHPIIKETVRACMNLLCWFLDLLPLQNCIVFESSPDFACNTYPVFLQMKEDLPDYKMVWCVAKGTQKPENVDDIFVYQSPELIQRFKQLFYMHTSRAIVFSNRTMEKYRDSQVALFLCHGSKTKKTRGVYEVADGVDHINVQSHFFDDIITYEYNCDKSKLVYLGYPRCDWLYQDHGMQVKQALGISADSGFCLWLPTFRKHKFYDLENQMDPSRHQPMGMPLVDSPEALKTLDELLAEKNRYLVYKPHPAQDVSGLKAAGARRVMIVNDAFLAEHGLQLNQVLAASDGLVTDYSSVFFDYLLTDKPMVTTVDDIAEWKKMTGFAFDLDAFLDRATVRAASLEDLMAALADIADGVDTRADARKEIREITNIHFDGNSAKRVSAFIREKIGA